MARSSLLTRETTGTALPSSRALAAPFLATMVAIGLAGLAPTLIISVTPEDGYPSNYFGPLIIAVVAALRLAEWKMYFFKNLSSPLWAEFFINGGWVFVAVGMLLLGLAVGSDPPGVRICSHENQFRR